MSKGDGPSGPEPGEERNSPDIPPLRAFCWGVLYTLGLFEPGDLAGEERLDCGQEKAWFGFGEVVMAGILALTITVPAAIWFAARAGPAAAVTGAAVLFLPLFVFLPRLIRRAMDTDTDAVLALFGKNEQIRNVFWALFTVLAGLVLAQVVDPEIARQIVGILLGTGG